MKYQDAWARGEVYARRAAEALDQARDFAGPLTPFADGADYVADADSAKRAIERALGYMREAEAAYKLSDELYAAECV